MSTAAPSPATMPGADQLVGVDAASAPRGPGSVEPPAPPTRRRPLTVGIGVFWILAALVIVGIWALGQAAPLWLLLPGLVLALAVSLAAAALVPVQRAEGQEDPDPVSGRREARMTPSAPTRPSPESRGKNSSSPDIEDAPAQADGPVPGSRAQ